MMLGVPVIQKKKPLQYEKSTLHVSFKWKCDDSLSFKDYFDHNVRCKNKRVSTNKIRFEKGFLASTDHYAQCYIILSNDPFKYDYHFFIKFCMGDTELPSFTNCEVSPPRIKIDLNSDNWRVYHPSFGALHDNIKQDLITQGHFADDEFEIGRYSKVYWLRWNGRIIDTRWSADRLLSMKDFTGSEINLNFEFEYCFWNDINRTMLAADDDDDDWVSAKKSKKLCAEEFLFSEKYSDFKIQCGAKSFYAHRIFIGEKSSVLAAMFDQSLEEAKQRKLVIKDFEPEAVEEFLRFIYTEKANVNDYATELFQLAHKYQVADLFRISETALIAQLDNTNLIDMNELGKLYNSKRLLKRCYSFFELHRASLVKTKLDMDKFSDFMFQWINGGMK